MTKQQSIIKIALICILTFAGSAGLYSCNGSKDKSSNSEGLRNFMVTAIPLDSAGWGYRIYEDTIPVIEQKFIPGVPGNAGFKTEQEAIKTGGLVKSKLEKGIWPPSVSEEELDSLGINFKH
ncbi:DUF4907 domain-containing protein [Dyadobacter sp. CY356]|uniref:DUF4907 domain-containing protein n=1 Tax=Dyadobacter sp. CY356 TaxID=2906442 RepID=UPI001F2ED17D|nr:DUF4907 domain-containing protein [Dyadobacter sp. CY356]MCF0054898.1 DUF4907 domain-containing protein [Dyadobacter sp. CY356]